MHKLLWHQSSEYTRKMYGRILDTKVRGITEPKILEEQGAVRKRRSCADQLITVRKLGKKKIGKNKRMFKGHLPTLANYYRTQQIGYSCEVYTG